MIALQALGWIVGDPDRAPRFLALTGLDPADLRARAGSPAVLAAALGFLAAHEADLVACADGLGVSPATLGETARELGRVTAEPAPAGRPLLITDCDEVLLHMVSHFRDWLGEHRGIDFTIGAGDFARSMKRREGAEPLAAEEMWALLGDFFPAEMDRQTLVPGAADALQALSATADIVVLTNLADQCRQPRIDQLAAFGIHHRVECNQGGKGVPVAKLLDEYRPSVAVFVDDLPVHHDSVARRAPGVHRLHMVSEPLLAAAMPPAAHAHARIDDWEPAREWIAARFAAGVPAQEKEVA